MSASTTLVAMAVMVAVAATSARAETVFEGDLDGPAAGTDSPAAGHATLVLNDAQTEVSYTVTYSNLVGDEVGAHFHAAPPGRVGAIVFELPPGTPKTGVWEIPPERVESLFDGHIYVVIHSDEFPAGEIAGWVVTDEVSADPFSWTAIRNLYHGETR